MSNEPAWKKTKNGKVLYHYYSSKTLNKRINENKIVERFANYYSIDVLSDINKNVYNNLNDTIINKSKRRDILNEDFDNGLIDEDDYRVQLKNINISIKETKLKLKNLQVQSEKFEDFPFDKKRAIVLSHVKRVNISFKNDIISFDFIDN